MLVKKILISNIYSWKNKGDAAIVLTMLDDIKSQFPETKIELSTHDSNDFGKYGPYQYHKNISTLVYGNVQRYRYKIILMLMFVLRMNVFHLIKSITGIKLYSIFGAELADKIRSYEDVDLIVACGGGYMLTETKSSIFGKYLFWHDYYVGSKLFKKPYILYNQSIGPFYSRLHESLALRILKRATHIILREELSFSRMKNYGLDNISLRSDIAFKLSVIPDLSLLEKYQYDKNRINVGITVRKWLSKEKQDQYEQSMAEFIDQRCAVNSGFSFYFMPQVIYSANNDNDLLVAYRVYDKVDNKYKNQVYVIDEDLHPSVLKYVIASMTYFIGTRMHSNIFALSSLVKTIAIAYEPKTTGIMKMLELPDYAIEMSDVNVELLNQKFNQIQSDNEYMDKLKERMQHVDSFTKSDIKGFICT